MGNNKKTAIKIFFIFIEFKTSEKDVCFHSNLLREKQEGGDIPFSICKNWMNACI